ncbi:hypothetical protein E2562_031988 [Oryza meyeriana var. granulata]|uniref:Uncharacterized protein n=1 Tax=Oryza meyeriana var. granulata TaxID=110450 RepID=A0A6G1F0B0_9ORYZ|nr:hypothetical protein E2562_031988 [Oryza meyeriana var. granulata]
MRRPKPKCPTRVYGTEQRRLRLASLFANPSHSRKNGGGGCCYCCCEPVTSCDWLRKCGGYCCD